MRRLGILAFACLLAGSCEQPPQSRASAASLAELCVVLSGEFRIPPDPNGPPQGNQNSEPALFRRLGDPDPRERAEAAKKILRHSERRVPAALDVAIHVSGSLGDYRVVNNLGKIATQWASADDPDGARVAYPLTARVAAAAAMGRILEQDRSSPPGHENDEGEGISKEAEAQAIEALKLSACPAEPTELRAAAIEALGIARNATARDFLEVVSADPVAPDDSRRLLITVLALRSITNIAHNNHLEESQADEQLRELARLIQEQNAVQP